VVGLKSVNHGEHKDHKDQRESQRKGNPLAILCVLCGLCVLCDSAAFGLDHLHSPAGAALSVDHLAAFFGPHPGAEADGSGALDLADLVGVMHRSPTVSTSSNEKGAGLARARRQNRPAIGRAGETAFYTRSSWIFQQGRAAYPRPPLVSRDEVSN
jgi:hypothetical protein